MIRALAPYLAFAYLTLVGWTTRSRILAGHHREFLRRRGQRFIYAFWHQRQVFFTYTHRNAGACILVSRSRDGAVISRVMDLSRIGSARGSSTRGSTAALKEMARTVSRGVDLGITPDGPKGPAREVKDGVLFLAQKLGMPILPLTNAVTRKLVFKKSWDRFQVPLPFGRGVVRYAPPITVGPEDDLVAKAAEVKRALDGITDQADAEVFREPSFLDGELVRAVCLLTTLAAPFIAALYVLGVLLSPRRRVLRTLREEISERTGRPDQAALQGLAGRPVVWIHAASVGEGAAVEMLVERIKARPDAPAVVMTCTTAAGRDRARKVPGVDAALLAPVDSLPTAGAFLRRVRPQALLLVETELWPCMLDAAFREGVRIGMANGRLSPRSFGRYRGFASLTAPFLRRIEAFAVQTQEDSARFEALGAPPERIRVCGNMKFDLLKPPGLEPVEKALQRLGWKDAPILVAGSTHPQEEDALLAAFREARRDHPDLKLVLAPRHVERSKEVEERLKKEGIGYVTWSGHGRSKASPAGMPCCMLINTIGILPAWYAFGAVCFVGGTLTPVGGHNLLEPAIHGKGVVFGPHTFHTELTARALESSGGGIRLNGPSDLGLVLGRLLADPGERAAIGRKARETLAGLRGAVDRTLEHIGPCLEP